MTRSKPFYLVNFSVGSGQPCAGLVLDGHILSLNSLADVFREADLLLRGTESIWNFLQYWPDNLAVMERGIAQGNVESAFSTFSSSKIDECRLHAPILGNFHIYCAAVNYKTQLVDLIVAKSVDPEIEGLTGESRRRQAMKMVEKRAAQGEPYIFLKPSSTVVGPNDDIELSADAEEPNAEIELGVVIGRTARRVGAKDAFSYVAGYTILNDIADRSLLARKDFPGADWLRGNGAPTYTPMGPYIVPAEFAPGPDQADLELRLNEVTVQQESSADMLLKIPQLIQYLSHRVELRPGDVIATGSPAPANNGGARRLRKGDVVTCAIAGLGMQRNRCV